MRIERIGDAVLYNGDCLEVMRSLPANSVDAIVTDPPYHLTSIVKRFGGKNAAPAKSKETGAFARASRGFMGQTWDGGDIAFRPETWEEALRVLKPGGHIAAFSGTRTYHRMAVAIEDAGFEIRDQLAWTYGSGFPKSHDVSKAIDKRGGDALAWRAFSEAYASAVSRSSMSHSDIDRTLGIKSSSCYWARTDHRGGMPPRHHWALVRDLLNLPASLAKLYDEAERVVLGERSSTRLAVAPGQGEDRNSRTLSVTSAGSDKAREWEGWGSALKPAWEPICLARKPLDGTIAENVLAHGVGALNVDGCRVGDEIVGWGGGAAGGNTWNEANMGLGKAGAPRPVAGRWPANILHDGEAGFGEQGRFFYCAKASKADRGEGNNHPTVKPTELMRWLCRLVTPPGGLVLDPFTGSGSTGRGAVLEGFRFVGAELSEDYAAIALKRIAAVIGQNDNAAPAIAGADLFSIAAA